MPARGFRVLPAQAAPGPPHLLRRPAQLLAGGASRPGRRRVGPAAEPLREGLDLCPQLLLLPPQPFEHPAPLVLRFRFRGLFEVAIDPLLPAGELPQAGERLVLLAVLRFAGLPAGLVARLLLAPQLPVEQLREVELRLLAGRPRPRLHRDLAAPDRRLRGQQLVQRLGLVGYRRRGVQRRERRLGRGHRLDGGPHRPALHGGAVIAGGAAPAPPGPLPHRAHRSRRGVAHVALHLRHRPHVVVAPALRLLVEPPRGHHDLLLQRHQPADLGRLRPQAALTQRLLELVVEGPDLQEVEVGTRLGRDAAETGVARPREVGDDVAGLDGEVLEEERADSRHRRGPLGDVERQRPLGPADDRVGQVHALDGVVVVGPHLDGHLLERRDLPIAAGSQHPHRRGAVDGGADEVVGRVPVRQSVGIDDPHPVPAVALDDESRGAGDAAGADAGQGHPTAVRQHQRPVDDRLVGVDDEPGGGAGRGEQVAAVLLEPRRETGEGRVDVLDVDAHDPRRRQRLDEIVRRDERGRPHPVPEAAGHRRELRDVAVAGRPHADVARGHAVEHRQDGRGPGRDASAVLEPGADPEGLAGHEAEVAGLHRELGDGRRGVQPGGAGDPAEGGGPEGDDRGERGDGEQAPRDGAPQPRRRDDPGDVDSAKALGGIGDHQLLEAGGGTGRGQDGGAGHAIFQLGAPLLDEPRDPLVRRRAAEPPQHEGRERERRRERGAHRREQRDVRRREEQLGPDDRDQADADASGDAGQTLQPPGGQPTAPDPGQGDAELCPVSVSHGANCLTRPRRRQPRAAMGSGRPAGLRRRARGPSRSGGSARDSAPPLPEEALPLREAAPRRSRPPTPGQGGRPTPGTPRR